MEESPFMKALRDFAMADPEDCDREWDAYLAVVNGKETSSGSPPTSSTSPLHHRARASAAAATASSATSSTATAPTTSSASHNVPSTTTTTTPAASASRNIAKDDLSPGARSIYDLLVGGSTAPASATSDASTVLGVPMELDTVHDAVSINITELAAPTPTTCLLDCPSRDLTSSTTSMTTGGSVSEHCCSEPEPAAASSTPTSELDLSHARSTTANFLTSGAISTTSSAATPACASTSTPSSPVASSASTAALPATISPAFAGPVVGVLLESGDNLTSPPPSVRLILCPSAGISTVASQACSINPVLAQGASPFSLTPAAYFVDNVDTAEHTEIRLPPWPPPCTQLKLWAAKISWPPALPNRSTGIQNIPQLDCQDMLFSPWTTLFPLHVESVEHTRSRFGIHLCCFCSQDAELLVFYFASCRIRYLHGTLDNIQLSADWQVLKTVGPKWSAIWFDLREARHQFAGIIVVKLKPPWPPSLGMCINLPTGDAVSGCHSCAVVIVGLAPIYLQLEQLTMVKFAAMMYMLAYAATLHHHFSSGHILLFSPAAPNSVMDFYFFPGLGMVVVFIPGLEQEQLTARLLIARVDMLETTQFYSTGLSSWKDALTVLNQWIPMSCNLYVWNSFEMALVLDGYDSTCLNGQFIQRTYFLVQWKIPWTIPLVPLKF